MQIINKKFEYHDNWNYNFIAEKNISKIFRITTYFIVNQIIGNY